jgi:hypothetical protein
MMPRSGQKWKRQQKSVLLRQLQRELLVRQPVLLAAQQLQQVALQRRCSTTETHWLSPAILCLQSFRHCGGWMQLLQEQLRAHHSSR